MSHLSIWAVASIMIWCGSASAEVYNCDGKWTNKPCSGEATQQFKEKEHDPLTAAHNAPEPDTSPPLEPLAPRYDLIRKLKKINKDYEAKAGVALTKNEIDGFEDFCLTRSTPYAECLQIFNQQSQRLVELNQAEEHLQLEAERNKIEADKVEALRRRAIVAPTSIEGH